MIASVARTRPGLDFIPEPTNAVGLGLPRELLVDLLLKTLCYGGRLNRSELAESLCVSQSAVDDVLQALAQDSLAEVLGSDGSGPSTYVYGLTQKGLDRADAAFGRNTYVGPAPVPLTDYLDEVREQTTPDDAVGREGIKRALSHVVVSETTAARVGRAVASRRPTLLYGASGNGKTTIARAVGEAVEGEIFIPHAIEIMGQIVRVFDPSKHVRVEGREPEIDGIFKSRPDRRWLRVKRPTIWAGGELTAESLELVRDESGVYEAPLQLKANGGTLIIDDFGRQRIPAVQLLNRWITALESGRDHLTLHTGQTVEAPFDVLVLFSTNLQPADLADEAFLRRIRYKVEICNPTADEYASIFERECARLGIGFDEDAFDHLMSRWYADGRELRGCQPRDILEGVVDAARYDRREPRLTSLALDEACRSYFAASDRA